MRATRTVQKILPNYEADNPGVKGKLCSMLMNGKLGGTGKMIILPVDQGFEHGLWRGLAHAALQQITGGRGLRNRYRNRAGHEHYKRLSELPPAKPTPPRFGTTLHRSRPGSTSRTRA